MQELAWQAMGLAQDPFPGHGQDDIFLQTPALGQRLSLFTQLTQASDLTLLLIGEHGIGKTTFLRRITQLLEDGWHIASLRANTETTFNEIHEQLCGALATYPDAKANISANDVPLGAQLQTLSANGYRMLVVVDDAQLLDNEVLMQLLELGRQVRLALAGDPSLAERVATVGESMTSSDAGLVHRIVLGELNSPQTTDYLRARLSRSGYTQTTPFKSEVCSEIYQRSRGVPGTINALASKFLESEPVAIDDDETIQLDPPTRDTSTVKAKLTTHAPIQPRISLHTERGRRGLGKTTPLVVLCVLVVALLAAGYGLYAWWTAEEPNATDTAQSIAVPAVEAPLDERYPELPTAPAPPPPSVLADTDAPLVETLPTPVAETDPTPTLTNNATGDATRMAVTSRNLAPLNESSLPDATAAEVAAAEVGAAEADSEALPRPRRAPRERRDEGAAVTPAPAAVETRPAPRARTPSAIASNTGNTWLESGDKNRFTVQLIALGSASATREFITRHQLSNALIVSLKTPDAKPVFAVVQGAYNRRERAQDAIRRFPTKLRQQAPWPRHIGTLLEAAHGVRAR